MKCNNKEIEVTGIEYNTKTYKAFVKTLYCICSNDEHGKSLSIDNGEIQFTIPFEAIEECFRGDYKK